MRPITITIDDNSLYINGRPVQRMEPGEQVTIGDGKTEYRFIVYRKIDKDRKIIKLADRKGARP